MSRPARRLSPGWTLACGLLGLYLFLKVQGWWYGFQVEWANRQRAQLRPVLSTIVLAEQIKGTQAAYAEVFDQVRRLGLYGPALLREFSEQTPPSVTLRELKVDARRGVTIRGTLMPGIRSPEEALLAWAMRVQTAGRLVRVHTLLPDHQTPGLWLFELRVEESQDA